MTECYQTSLPFPRVSRRRVEADFTGGDISSDGGVLLLRQANEKVGLTRALSKARLIRAGLGVAPTASTICCANASVRWRWAMRI